MENTEQRDFSREIARLKQENASLKMKLAAMDKVKGTVRRNFQDMVHLLTSMMSMSNRYLGGHVRRVGELIKAFTEHLNLGNDTVFLFYYAALLHDIGLIGIQESVILKPENDLDEHERAEFRKHPAAGEKIIGSMYNLKRVAVIIRAHHEEYSGGGYPDGIYGDAIPLGSRYLRVVNDYDNMLFKTSMTRRQALLAIEDRAGIVYDQKIAELYCDFIRNTQTDGPEEIHEALLKNLKPGMILAEDIHLTNGMMLVPKGMLLNHELTEKISSFSSLLDMTQTVKVIH